VATVRNLNLSRVRTFHPRGVKCPTCTQHAIRLIIPKEASDGDWTQARCNRCAHEYRGPRKQEIPQYGAYPTVRHLAGSRVPFSLAFVVSSTGQPRSEVGGVIKDAFDWGWINEAEGKTPEGETLWIGRL